MSDEFIFSVYTIYYAMHIIFNKFEKVYEYILFANLYMYIIIHQNSFQTNKLCGIMEKEIELLNSIFHRQIFILCYILFIIIDYFQYDFMWFYII